jgi:hypothetical protein
MKSIFFLKSLTILFLLASCGQSNNVYYSLVNRTTVEKAALDIQNQDYTKANTSLSSYLATHPWDENAKFMLANSYLKSVGIDFKDVIYQAYVNSDSYTFTTLLQSLPSGSSDTLGNTINAYNTLSNDNPGDPDLKLAYALTNCVTAIMVMKSTTMDANNNVQTTLVNNLSASYAVIILGGLNQCAAEMSTLSYLPGSFAATMTAISDAINLLTQAALLADEDPTSPTVQLAIVQGFINALGTL